MNPRFCVVGGPGRRFTAEEVALPASIAGQVGASVENAHLVADNGRGLDPQAAENSGGLGLHTVRQRAERARGTLHIDSTPGARTRIRITVKLGPKEGQSGRTDGELSFPLRSTPAVSPFAPLTDGS